MFKKYYPHAERNQFLTPLRVTPLADGVRWVLDADLVYVDPDGQLITVPAGFTTDFASIPPLATAGGWGVMAAVWLARWFPLAGWPLFCAAWWVILQADGFEHEGTWDAASCLHDWLYASRGRGFFAANRLLYVAMAARGGGRTAAWKRWVIWQAVNLGGWVAWRDDARKARKDWRFTAGK